MRTKSEHENSVRRSGAPGLGRLIAGFAVLVLLASVALVGLDAVPASAHTPHDVVGSISVSPSFNEDHTVYSIVREYLLKSTDGGISWKRLNRGLDNKHNLSAVLVGSKDAKRLYASTRGDGIYRSDDAGASWRKINQGLPDPLNFVSLFLSPHDDDLVYVVTVDGQVMRTTDGGQSWGAVAGLKGNDITAMAFTAADPSTVFAGAHGVLLSSTDGERWTKHDMGADEHVLALAPSPGYATDETLFVGMASKGLLKSTDGAKTFRNVSDGLTDKRIQGLLVSQHFTDDHDVMVSTWNDGVFRSQDGGSSWKRASKGLTTDSQANLLKAPEFRELSASSEATAGDRTMFVAGFNGLFRSVDDGAHWDEVTTQDATNIAALAISPDYPKDGTLADGAYINGALRSDDHGETWTAINAGITSQVPYLKRNDYYARLTSMHFSPEYATDHTMYAGSRGYFYTSTNKGETWKATIPRGLVVPNDFPPDYLIPAFAPDYQSSQLMYAGTDTGMIFRAKEGQPLRKIASIGSEIVRLQVGSSKQAGGVLIAATVDGVQIGTNQGTKWKKIPSTPKGLLSLAVSSDFATDGTAFVGTKNGLLGTVDGGKAWRRITGLPFGDTAYIESLATSPAFDQDHLVLVSVRGEGLFRSDDGGKTFAPTGQNLIDNNVVLCPFYHASSEPILFSPGFATDHTIYGIAQNVLYRSTDSGDSWSPISIPRSTHPLTEASAPNDLLITPRYKDVKAKSKKGAVGGVTAIDRAKVDHTVLVLSPKRVLLAAAVALVALAALWLLKFGSRTAPGRLAIYVRVACSIVVFAVVLFFLSNR